MLDEMKFRRESFREGEWVTLADGSRWSAPRPFVRFVPAEDPNEPQGWGVGVVLTYGHASPIDDLVDAARDAPDPDARLGALFRLAVAMLAVNYELGRDDLAAVLGFDASDPQGFLHLIRLFRVATGEPPEVGPESEAETAAA